MSEDLPRDIGRVLGGKKSENVSGATRIPLQLQQSAMVVVCDLANVKWATYRPKTRRVAQEGATRVKIRVPMWLVGGKP